MRSQWPSARQRSSSLSIFRWEPCAPFAAIFERALSWEVRPRSGDPAGGGVPAGAHTRAGSTRAPAAAGARVAAGARAAAGGQQPQQPAHPRRLGAGAPAERPGRVQEQPPPLLQQLQAPLLPPLQLLSQPPPQAWAPPASDPPPAAAPPPRGRGAASASRERVTLMLRGAPEVGGASLATPPPSHRGSWPGRPPPRRPGFMWWPRHHRCPARHKSRERPAGRSLPTPRASLPGEPPAAARVPP